MQAAKEREAWTFEVAKNPAAEYSLHQLCGLVEPENWHEDPRCQFLHKISLLLFNNSIL